MLPMSRLALALLAVTTIAVAVPFLQERAKHYGEVHTGRMAPSNFGSVTGCGNVDQSILDSLDEGAYAGIFNDNEGKNCGQYIAISNGGGEAIAALLIETTAVHRNNIVVSNGVYKQLGLNPGVGGVPGIKWALCNSDDPSDCPKKLKSGQNGGQDNGQNDDQNDDEDNNQDDDQEDTEDDSNEDDDE